MSERRIRIYDLSDTLRLGTHEPLPLQINYFDHEAGARQAAAMLGLELSDFPDCKAWAIEQLTLTTHSGTHLDAPYHFGPLSGGEPARTIDQVPLEWCYGDGVVLDFSDKPAGYEISAADVQEALRKIGYTLKPFDIVLIRTDVYKHFAEPGYDQMHPGMSEEATLWLIDQGIKVMGIDAWGWDQPLLMQAEECRRGEKGKLWDAHFAGKKKEYCHIEKLANLDKLPRPFGFKVAVFPVRIERASAGWARCVAIFEE
ncbi:MAG: cyclase family protein [Chloroflexota bacterium]